MADYTQTINESFNIYAPEPTNKWGTLIWGTDNWSRDGDHVMEVGKLISETTTLTSAMGPWDITKLITDALTLTDTVIKDGVTTRTESLTMTSPITDLIQTDSEGYYHIFISDVSDAADRATTTYTEATDPSTDWTEATAASTTWS